MRGANDLLPWDQGCYDGFTVVAYCKGCRATGALHTSAMLDGFKNVPAAERFTVGRILKESVGCPCPGPSHRTVELEWEQQT